MFSGFTSRLQQEVETIKLVLDTHDGVRGLIFRQNATQSALEATATQQPDSDTERAIDRIRATAPLRPSWQVYDHCAAFTRLYAVYEQFVENLVSEYLRMLPSLYARYEDLPPAVTTQHRLGTAQVLQKLGKDGPYRDLEERSIIGDLSHGLLGNPNYKLLRHAFLIDPQNYRAEVVIKLFSYLGFENPWAWVEKHPSMLEFMLRHRDPTDTAKTLLHEFVEHRNEASHTLVRDTVATDEIKLTADFIIILSETLAQLVMRQVVRRKKRLGEATEIGQVVHKFSNQIVGAKMNAGTLAIGDSLVVVQKQTCYKTTVRSIQIQKEPHVRLQTIEDQEIGLGLSASTNEGALLLRLAPEQQTGAEAVLIPEPLSPDDFPVQTDSATANDADG
jgi:HEPN superfamily protein